MKIIIKKNNIDILEFDELNKTNIFNNIVDFMRTNQVIRKYIKIQVINEFTELEERPESDGQFVRWKDVRKLITEIRTSNGL